MAEGEERRELLGECFDRMESMMDPAEELEPTPISDAFFEVYPLRYLGEISLAKGDLEGARIFYRRALEADPDYTAPLCGLAAVARAEGRHREALQIYLKALSINENEFEAWVGGAEVLIGLGFEDNARSWLDKLSAFLPEDPRLQEMLGAIGPRTAVTSAR